MPRQQRLDGPGLLQHVPKLPIQELAEIADGELRTKTSTPNGRSHSDLLAAA